MVILAINIALEMNDAADQAFCCYEYMTNREAAACKYQRGFGRIPVGPFTKDTHKRHQAKQIA